LSFREYHLTHPQWGVYHDGQATGSVVPSDYARTYVPYDTGNIKRLILIVRGQSLRGMYDDGDGKVVANFVFDLTPYAYTGGRVGFVTWNRAAFMNFVAAPLSGPKRVTQFCNGGTCTGTGLCE